MSEPKGLVIKLCEVMAAVERVPKNGFNKFQNYAYATEADVADCIRKEFASRHIMLFPSVIKQSRILIPPSDKNYISEIEVEWTFVDGDTGESRTQMIPGSGMDTGDKGLYKALTGSEKYLLMKTFLIPTGDDPEADSKAEFEQGKANAQSVAKEKLAHKALETANSAARLSVELKPYNEGCLGIHGSQEALVKLVTAGLAKSAVYLDVAGLYILQADKAEAFSSWAFKSGVDVKMDPKAREMAAKATPASDSQEMPYEAVDDDIPFGMEAAPIMGPVKSIQGKFLVFTWDGKERSCWHKSMWPLLTDNQNKPAELSCVDKEKGGKNYSNVEGIISLNSVEYQVGQDEKWRPVIQRAPGV